jgi:hypothetical protein
MHGTTVKKKNDAKSFSEKFQCIENRYNMKMVFRMKHTFSMSLMRTRPEKANFVCSKCGRNYDDVTDMLLAV